MLTVQFALSVWEVIFKVGKLGSIRPLPFDSPIDIGVSVEHKKRETQRGRQNRESRTETRIEQKEDAPKHKHHPSHHHLYQHGFQETLWGASLTPQPRMSPLSPTLSYIAHSVCPTPWPIYYDLTSLDSITQRSNCISLNLNLTRESC